MYLEQTLEGAVKAKCDTYSLGSQFDSKGAWEDCMDLHDQTIYRLNQFVLSCLTNACSGSDVQTWLSMTLTNLDTCREGMSELGVSSESLQSVLANITIDVINALAIIKGMKQKMKINENEFGVLKQGAMESPSTNGERVDVVVAQDGSGDYKTIQEAIDGAGIEAGDKTIITGDRSNDTGFRTFDSTTFVAKGDGLVLREMTISNTAGPEKKLAVALRMDLDASAFHGISIEGFQDTLYVYANRQFFKECHIYGTVDFICGDAAIVFQDCQILAQRPPGGVNTITVQSRVSKNHTGGIVIHNSVVKGDPKVRLGGMKTYLGRPWKRYARTVVMRTQLGQLIEPK
ncbi:unnamed protein product [Arabis nemorensis]|uniref:Uncharacterized protein n=1 Tax=Arabis nemorensis TaxID=586526 RepID=A0A565CBI5_9BRAS|nr:unnamed protein product [Arabis nemorensis]